MLAGDRREPLHQAAFSNSSMIGKRCRQPPHTAPEGGSTGGQVVLTGENPLDPGGPTFDELKTIVADPERRDDPDGKATTVARECARKLQEDSENS
jgi:hypothetical protein